MLVLFVFHWNSLLVALSGVIVAVSVPVSPSTKVFLFESNVIPVTGTSGAFTVTLQINVNTKSCCIGCLFIFIN